MQGNRPYRGINWVSGVELVLRAISVAVALSIVGLEKIENADLIAGTDEAGHAFQFEAGRVFQSEAGHPWRQSHGSI